MEKMQIIPKNAKKKQKRKKCKKMYKFKKIYIQKQPRSIPYVSYMFKQIKTKIKYI